MHDNPWWKDTIYPNWAQAERDWWTRSDGANVDWAAFDASWGVSGENFKIRLEPFEVLFSGNTCLIVGLPNSRDQS